MIPSLGGYLRLLLVALALLVMGCGAGAPAEMGPVVPTSPPLHEGPVPLAAPVIPNEPTPVEEQPATLAPVAIPTLVRNADGYARVSVAQLVELRESADLFLVHVHFLHEWEIPETDLYLPVNDLPIRLNEIPPRDALIVLYCRSGNVSQTAAKYLAEHGYTNVADLVGGYTAWHAAGYPLLDRR